MGLFTNKFINRYTIMMSATQLASTFIERIISLEVPIPSGANKSNPVLWAICMVLTVMKWLANPSETTLEFELSFLCGQAAKHLSEDNLVTLFGCPKKPDYTDMRPQERKSAKQRYQEALVKAFRHLVGLGEHDDITLVHLRTYLSAHEFMKDVLNEMSSSSGLIGGVESGLFRRGWSLTRWEQFQKILETHYTTGNPEKFIVNPLHVPIQNFHEGVQRNSNDDL